jgi:hypothetical protein
MRKKQRVVRDGKPKMATCVCCDVLMDGDTLTENDANELRTFSRFLKTMGSGPPGDEQTRKERLERLEADPELYEWAMGQKPPERETTACEVDIEALEGLRLCSNRNAP